MSQLRWFPRLTRYTVIVVDHLLHNPDAQFLIGDLSRELELGFRKGKYPPVRLCSLLWNLEDAGWIVSGPVFGPQGRSPHRFYQLTTKGAQLGAKLVEEFDNDPRGLLDRLVDRRPGWVPRDVTAHRTRRLVAFGGRLRHYLTAPTFPGCQTNLFWRVMMAVDDPGKDVLFEQAAEVMRTRLPLTQGQDRLRLEEALAEITDDAPVGLPVPVGPLPDPVIVARIFTGYAESLAQTALWLDRHGQHADASEHRTQAAWDRHIAYAMRVLAGQASLVGVDT